MLKRIAYPQQSRDTGPYPRIAGKQQGGISRIPLSVNAPSSVIAKVSAVRPRLAAANRLPPPPARRPNGRIRCFAAGVAVGAMAALIGVALHGGGL